MRAVIQRVSRCSVDVDGKTVSQIGNGLLVLLGVQKGDGEEDARLLAAKISKIRIFGDSEGKMNLSCKDVGGDMLIVSNFTLCGDYHHGNRPSFFDAEEPTRADLLYEYFSSLLENDGYKVGRGVFGGDMKVSLLNDGPITMVLDSSVLKKG